MQGIVKIAHPQLSYESMIWGGEVCKHVHGILFLFLEASLYFVKKNKNNINELVLGPFQGPVACTRIAMGKGVCGTAWKENKIIIVNDVDKFPGHIACSSDSKSEIVIPCTNKNGVFAILDIDSDKLADFDETDKKYLHQIVKIIEHINYV